MRHTVSMFLALLLLAPAASAADKGRIAKCQDATGRWHYGDAAARECEKSKITEMSERGITKRQVDAPLTEAERKRKEAAVEEEKRKRQETEERQRSDRLLLSTYGHEKDIVLARDRKLSQVDASIRAGEATVKSLRGVLARLESQTAEDAKDPKAAEQNRRSIEQTSAQIEKHEAVLAAKREEREQIGKQAEADLARFRDLKGVPAEQEKTPAAAR